MKKLALLFAVSEYEKASKLDACTNDLNMMHQLLKESGEFADILISLNDKSSNARDKLIAFVEKYKDQDIDQIFFYFSGHGYRDADQFYFCFKNTNLEALNSTTITSHDIDGYLKVLKPKVTVKVIDACYSGESYIKSMDDTFYKVMEEEQRKAFEEIYFMFSSRRTEPSLATEQYSLFTRLFLEPIKYCDDSSSITYKYIIDYISDHSPTSLRKHTPYFVTQGAYMAYLFSDLKVPKQILLDDFKLLAENARNENEECTELINRVRQDATSYCNEALGIEKLNLLVDLLRKLSFSDELLQLFDITHYSFDYIPYNSAPIGRWLNKSDIRKENFLAQLEYEEYVTIEQQYIEKVRHPFYSFAYSDMDDMYELQDVEVRKSKISGIRSLLEINDIFFNFKLAPKIEFPNLQHYAVSLALLSSKKKAVIFYCVEELVAEGWNTAGSPECSQWLQYDLLLKEIDSGSLNNLSNILNKNIIKKIELLLS